jgi:hypothetical protein
MSNNEPFRKKESHFYYIYWCIGHDKWIIIYNNILFMFGHRDTIHYTLLYLFSEKMHQYVCFCSKPTVNILGYSKIINFKQHVLGCNHKRYSCFFLNQLWHCIHVHILEKLVSIKITWKPLPRLENIQKTTLIQLKISWRKRSHEIISAITMQSMLCGFVSQRNWSKEFSLLQMAQPHSRGRISVFHHQSSSKKLWNFSRRENQKISAHL